MTNTDEMAAREKRITKLRKCLALTKSSNPHEAAAALRHAQALMRELKLTETDVLGLDASEAVVKTREGFGNCRTMSYLAELLKKVFGVEPVFERNPGTAKRLNVRYIGPRDRVALAEYTHKVMWRAMETAWSEHLTLRPYFKSKSGARQAFHIGWLQSVEQKVIDVMARTEDEERAINALMVKRYGKGLVTFSTKPRNLNGGAYRAGQAAAGEFELHRPMQESQKSIGYKG